MSEKDECPVCESYTSSVWSAFRDGEGCPHCGASAELVAQVATARQRHADENLVNQLKTLGLRVETLQRENGRLRAQIRRVRDVVAQKVDGEFRRDE